MDRRSVLKRLILLMYCFIFTGEVHAQGHIVPLFTAPPRCEPFARITVSAATIQRANEYRSRLVAHPQDAQHALRLAQILVATGKLREAIPYFDRAISANPKDPNTIYSFAVVLRNQKMISKTVSYLNRVIALDPKYACALNDLAIINRDRHEYSIAESYFNRAIAACPTWGPFYANRAELWLRCERFRDALAEAEKATVFAPEYPEGYRIAALASVALGCPRKALQLANMAVHHAGNDQSFLATRAYVLVSLNRNTEALADCVKVLRSNSNVSDEIRAYTTSLKQDILLRLK